MGIPQKDEKTKDLGEDGELNMDKKEEEEEEERSKRRLMGLLFFVVFLIFFFFFCNYYRELGRFDCLDSLVGMFFHFNAG